MDLVNVLRQANEIVREAGLPEPIQPIAFWKVCDALLGDAQPSATSESDPVNWNRTDLEDGEDSANQRIAEKLDIPVDRVRDIYFMDGNSLGLALPSGALSKSMSEGARQIALLIVVGRQAAQMESDGWTHSSEIRKVCDHYGKFDVGNFGKTLRAMADVFQIKGTGTSRQVRPRQLAYERAAALIQELAEDR